MNSEYLTEIIRALQQQMLEMQQLYEGESVTLRAKNTVRAAREKVAEDEDRTVQVEQTSHPFIVAETDQLVGIILRNNSLRIMQEKNTLATHIFEQFVSPTFKMYDETTDPEEHLKMFVNQMTFHTQDKGDSLKTFMDCYKKIVMRTKNIHPEFALQHAVTTLKPKPFANSLCCKSSKTMEKLREGATKDIRVEEVREFRRKHDQDVVGEKKEGKKSNWGSEKPCGSPNTPI
ncbi:hypothetical protein LR48_Vigan01g128500 [Vigna angularis]|uniref:Retrotransposon gag domain-containing protein n=1 Tax=Phaseolus angularis TaxID=3914 RepID=A0A0L9TME5_PHAAN|nr:hypothetical protein LR48_Vigan01g128500 [Vigna angularis]